MQQKSGRDLWPPFVSMGFVLKGLALGRVQPHMSFNNHSGYSRVRVSTNDDVPWHIGKSRADISESTHPGRLLPAWPMILSNLGQPRFKWRIPKCAISHREIISHRGMKAGAFSVFDRIETRTALHPGSRPGQAFA